MTSEEWKKAEAVLSHPHGTVYFKIDGYDVAARVMPKKPMQYHIVIYVNGVIDFNWAIEESDIRKRFYCRNKKSLLSQKELKKLSKSRRQQLKYKYTSYSPFFNSFRSMKSVFCSNNKTIEITEMK